MMHSVVGLDLSLANTGMCFIPAHWEGDMDSLRLMSIRTTRKEAAYGKPHIIARLETERYLEIAERVVGFVKEVGCSGGIVKENYAYSPVRSKNGHPVQSASVTRLAELGGVIRSQVLMACHTPVVSVAVNSARKFLTGGIKRGKQKEQVDRFLQGSGLRFNNWDEMDAFVVAYYWYGKINEERSRFLRQSELKL